jgi:hypothetical protein
MMPGAVLKDPFDLIPGPLRIPVVTIQSEMMRYFVFIANEILLVPY